MSGVYIKGLKMPRSCDECYIREKDTCPILKANLTGWGRRIDCPLVPVETREDALKILAECEEMRWIDERKP